MVTRAAKQSLAPANDNAPGRVISIRVPLTVTLAELQLLESVAADLIADLASKVANDRTLEGTEG